MRNCPKNGKIVGGSTNKRTNERASEQKSMFYRITYPFGLSKKERFTSHPTISTQDPAWSDQLKKWSESSSPVGHRGEFADVRRGPY